MNFWGIFAIGVGLSMDAFAVSICKGLSMKKINLLHMVIIAFFFGAFQFLMPVLGYYLCVQFESYVVSFDHWIAFVLLGFLGGKMIFEALKKEKESHSINPNANLQKEIKQPLSKEVIFENNEEEKDQTIVNEENYNKKNKLNIKELFGLSIATSIDALAVGITFAFLNVNIFGAGAIVGITTFVLCCIGVLVGNFFGSKFKKFAEIAGGAILILMGLKILLEHLGFLVF